MGTYVGAPKSMELIFTQIQPPFQSISLLIIYHTLAQPKATYCPIHGERVIVQTNI